MNAEAQTQEKFETWAIVELMGHRKLAGKVSEAIIAGAPLLRIDVPEVPGANGGATVAGFTQFYGAASIYCLTPCSESVARMIAQARREQPIQQYELAALPAPPRVRDANGESRTLIPRMNREQVESLHLRGMLVPNASESRAGAGLRRHAGSKCIYLLLLRRASQQRHLRPTRSGGS